MDELIERSRYVLYTQHCAKDPPARPTFLVVLSFRILTEVVAVPFRN